jgi:adenosylcobinamide kinase / adenosylcobinamide-phosphate guanylyltransferase
MLTLILGGARSGKSCYAQLLCGASKDVIYIATARAEGDEEMQARISRHRADRPHEWTTVEEPLEVARIVRQAAPAGARVLIDCVTVWLANLAWEHRVLPDERREALILERATELAQVTREREVIAVSNEVGSGIVPDHPVGRAFRDYQGLVNQLLAREAEHVVLMVAGLPLTLKDVWRHPH